MGTTITAAVLAALLATGATAPLAASDDDPTPPAKATLAELQQLGDEAIGRRLTALDAATKRVAAVQSLDDRHRATIDATVDATRDGLAALRVELAGDTDAASAREDYRRIFTDFRVYAVVLPQTFVAAGADRALAVTIPRLEDAADRLEQEVVAQGRDDLADEISELRAEISVGAEGVDTLAEQALAVTPAVYNTDPDAMRGIRISARTAFLSLRSALTDARALAHELR
ncbi:MAG: hypothetical protein QM675_09820 [Protaetiibacter sp.]